MTNFHPTQLIKHLLLIFYMLGKFACFFSSEDIFSKNSFRKTIHMSNRLDPDQDRHSVGSDLGPNCLHRLLANEKVNRRLVMKRILSQKRKFKGISLLKRQSRLQQTTNFATSFPILDKNKV